MARVSGFHGLADRFREIGRRVETNIQQQSREALLLGDRTFVLATPVDEGTARASTIFTEGAPATEEQESPVRGDGGAAAAFALAQALGPIAEFDALDEETAFITQTTSYSIYLN